MTSLFTTEFVSDGHPDKVCDAVSDGVLDTTLDLADKLDIPVSTVRTAIETMIKDNLVIVSGEINAPRELLAEFDLEQMVRDVWTRVGYDHQGTPSVIDNIKPQSAEIAQLVDGEGLAVGAGDQGIMCGFACRETDNHMPTDFDLARALILRLQDKRVSGDMPHLRSDAKTQVSIDADGKIHAVIVSTQHSEDIPLLTLRDQVMEQIIVPVLGDVPADIVKINHKGSFVLGGSAADCGVTGRKIVVDQYGPRTPVGGGAFSGKDPSKVDRSAAYMARNIALTALAHFDTAKTVSVQLAYGIGQAQPTSVQAMLETGEDISGWVNEQYPNLSPAYIQAALGLWVRDGWNYSQTSSMGHFGRAQFPWEQVK